jgi:carbon monoxide dehydrogenase subunit G
MTRIETSKVQVKKTAEEIFNFLLNFNNFQKLMPEGKVSGWNSSEKDFSFVFSGMARIGMAHSSNIPHKEIHIVSNGSNPFDFTLKVNIDGKEDGTSHVHMEFEAEINPFIKAMVEKPLDTFFNSLTQNLQKLNDGL